MVHLLSGRAPGAPATHDLRPSKLAATAPRTQNHQAFMGRRDMPRDDGVGGGALCGGGRVCSEANARLAWRAPVEQQFHGQEAGGGEVVG